MPYRLHVQVVEAYQLANLDMENHTFPYCLIQVSNSSDIKRTKVAERTTQPEWNQEFFFIVKNPKVDSLKVYIKDFTKLRSHSVMSTLALRLNQFNIGELFDQWYKLTPVKGVNRGGLIHLMIKIDLINSNPRLRFQEKKVEQKKVEEQKEEEPVIQEPEPIAPPIAIVPIIKTSSNRNSASSLQASTDFGTLVETENPIDIKIIQNQFDFMNESPSKQFTIERIEDIILDKNGFGPVWALANIARNTAKKADDFFTKFGLGFEKAINEFTLSMRDFLDHSNHDIGRNRLRGTNDPVLGQLYKSFFAAMDKSIAALRRKQTLGEARSAINDSLILIDQIREESANNDDFNKIKEATAGAFKSYENRNLDYIYSKTVGINWTSLGVAAALASIALSSMEHTMNCYICNSFGTRICVTKKNALRVNENISNNQNFQHEKSKLPPIPSLSRNNTAKLIQHMNAFS